jgi:hypothetical protein
MSQSYHDRGLSSPHFALVEAGWEIVEQRAGVHQTDAILPAHFARNGRAKNRRMEIAQPGCTKQFVSICTVRHPGLSSRMSAAMTGDRSRCRRKGSDLRSLGRDDSAVASELVRDAASVT